MRVYNTLIGRTVSSTKKKLYEQWYHRKQSVHYLYYLLDRNQDIYIPFQTKNELMVYVEKNNVLDCINLTGKDTYYNGKLDCYCLRPYQVFNSDWRTIDIRDWDYPADKSCVWYIPYNYSLDRAGRKHMHRTCGPAMYKRTLRESFYVIDAEELPVYKIRIKHCIPKINKDDVWDYYENAHGRDYACSKCWKDQVRVDKQYQKKERKLV